jgi:hypothetical protein
MSNVTDFQSDTDVEIWWKTTKQLFGKDVTSKIVGTGVKQLGYEYIKEIIAYVGDDEVSKWVFDKLPAESEDFDKVDTDYDKERDVVNRRGLDYGKAA